ncbi:hypothetical protein BDV36DRAFT_262856 [Aspergillus pseudocaelatus]|uniref:Uncharacterized protein n=1 Tax=Aspergillus pseudocaelatus TaxID=1825620 RepID=A0ABQ6WED8_9EURO|nr:hypothetical protein BDV36DRAFT_262856 [Aspergillus pseudocaelatus]
MSNFLDTILLHSSGVVHWSVERCRCTFCLFDICLWCYVYFSAYFFYQQCLKSYSA